MKNTLLIIGILLFAIVNLNSQMIPGENQNTHALVTFGPLASGSWGDDDHSQIHFVEIPKEESNGFYIRVWDPDLGGLNDQVVSRSFNSKTRFSIYGGEGAHSHEDSRHQNPKGEYKKGVLLSTNTFGVSSKHDDSWYTFGPFYTNQGELNKEGTHHIFKIICEGTEGDDGNIYRYFVSAKSNQNLPVLHSAAYTYESTIRLKEKGQAAHFYPYIDEKVLSVRQFNFDLDRQVDIRIFSKEKRGYRAKSSSNNDWASNQNMVMDEERFNCWDLRYVNKSASADNDVTIYFVNEYDETIKQYNSPIGDIKVKYKFSLKRSQP